MECRINLYIRRNQRIITDTDDIIIQEGCSRSKFLSKNLNIFVKNFREIFPEKTTQQNSDLAGYQFRVNNGVPEYKAGADAAWVPFKREPIISTASFSWAYSPVQTFPAKEGYKIIGLYVDITGINSSDYVNVNFGISKNLETGKISITGQTGVNIMGKFYCVYA